MALWPWPDQGPDQPGKSRIRWYLNLSVRLMINVIMKSSILILFVVRNSPASQGSEIV